MEKSDDELLCGYGKWRPSFLQPLHRPWCLLVALCLSSIAQGMLMNGLVPISLSTLEKRFYLQSAQTAVFFAMSDLGIVLVLLIICHYGGTKGHKGLWLGGGMLILGVGAFICTIPQYVVGPYQYASSEDGAVSDHCPYNGSQTCGTETASVRSSGLYYVLLLGEFLMGVGAAPLYTLGITFIDENVAQEASGLYNGIYYAAGVVGPVIGFMAGGAFLQIPGDIDKIDTSTLTITSEDSRWYGAWWIGFLCGGIIAFLCSIPLCGFATELPGAKHHRAKDVDQAYDKGQQSAKFGSDLKHLPINCLTLLKNPTFDLLILMQIFEAFLMNGFLNFLPKIMENFFDYSTSMASMITGAVAVPGGVLGMIMGGVLIKRLHLKCNGMIIVTIICETISMVLVFLFAFHCDQQSFAGVNVGYVLDETHFIGLNSRCNQNCSCIAALYNPVCATTPNGSMLYYSPCYAGCKASTLADGKQVYSNCSCVAALTTDSYSPPTLDEVVPGLCKTDCASMIPFLVFFSIIIFVGFTAAIPIQQATLRCIQFQQRDLAMAIVSIITRLLGSIPGGILMGTAIDGSCYIWQTSCDGRHVCLRYNSSLMSSYLMAFGFTLKAAMIVTLLAAWRCYRSATATVVADASSASTAKLAFDIDKDA